MVLATKVGKKRSFGRGFLLTIVTFGIYAIYWQYKAHNELYRQFELEREDRTEGMVWYVLGLTLTPLLLVYFWLFADNVGYLRTRIGLARQMTPGRYVALWITGLVALVAGLIYFNVATSGLEADATEAQVASAIQAALGPLLALLLLSGGLIAVAYRGLQNDINELWDAFDARISYLTRHPEEMAVRPAYMADLSVATPSSLATPLRGEVERLRARHPTLRAFTQFDELLARAEAGDAEARERGEVLLSDLAGALQERAELMRLRDERANESALIKERIAAGTIFEDDLRRKLAQLGTSDLDERLELLDQALFSS